MNFWDAGTHMSKKEWAVACRRVMNRLKSLRTELDANAAMKTELGAPARKPQRRAARTTRTR
jgi:hypothetical protein